MTSIPVKHNLLAWAAKARRLTVDGWSLGALLIAGFVALPVAAVVWLALSPSDDIWQHLAATVLPHYIRTTLLLMTGVGLGTLVLGAGSAWLAPRKSFRPSCPEA